MGKLFSTCTLLLVLIAVTLLGQQFPKHNSSSHNPINNGLLSGSEGPHARMLSGPPNEQSAAYTVTAPVIPRLGLKAPNRTAVRIRCPVKTCRVVPATVASCQCITLASYKHGDPVCCTPGGHPVPPHPYYPGDKAALLLGLQQNPDIINFIGNGWTESDPLCKGPQSMATFWTGIECADPIMKPGVVSKVLLMLSPFSGTLPAAWGSLLEPVEIDLSQNFLTGTLPPEWGQLSKLQTLKLHWNRLTVWDPVAKGLNGTIPAAWAGMTELQTLTLAGNNLEGTFPAEALKSLSKLNYLTVDNNVRLSGYLPSSWQQRTFMSFTTGVDFLTGLMQVQGPYNYGRGGFKLYTGSGPLWRTNITNWEGVGNNSALNPDPQPNPTFCVSNPQDLICV